MKLPLKRICRHGHEIKLSLGQTVNCRVDSSDERQPSVFEESSSADSERCTAAGRLVALPLDSLAQAQLQLMSVTTDSLQRQHADALQVLDSLLSLPSRQMQAIKAIPKRPVLDVVKPFFAVSLDAMDTVIKMKEDPSDVYLRFGEERGISANPEVMSIRLKAVMKNMKKWEPCYAYGGGGTEHWWKEVVRAFFFEHTRDPEVIDKLFKDLFDYYATMEPWKLVENDIASTLKTIKDHGFKLAIASDFDFRLRNIFEQLKLTSFVDVWMLSGEQGVRRVENEPSANPFYRRVVDLFEKQNLGKYQPRDIVHIGCKNIEDFMHAKNFGLQSILLVEGNDQGGEDSVLSEVRSFRNKPPLDLITPSISYFVENCITGS